MIKKLNIINKDIRINDEVWNEVIRKTAENSNADDQIFEDIVINNNLLNSKVRNIYAKIKFSTRRSNWLTEIKNSLSNVERRTNTITFATIDEISIEKEWNAMKIENFDAYTNDCNSENFLIVSLISRNRLFAIKILSKQSTLLMNYAKEKNNNAMTIIENTNFDTFAIAFDLSISQTFDIFSSSTSFFFYMNHMKL